jgi:hypothetical protein
MSSILGTGVPQIVYDRGGAGEVTISLPYSLITSSEPDTDLQVNESDIDGTREVYDRGTHWTVEILYHLYKEADPITKYGVLTSYKNTPVTFYLHDDASPFTQAADPDADAMFVLKEVEPFYLESARYKDGLRLTFESMQPVHVGVFT